MITFEGRDGSKLQDDIANRLEICFGYGLYWSLRFEDSSKKVLLSSDSFVIISLLFFHIFIIIFFIFSSSISDNLP